MRSSSLEAFQTFIKNQNDDLSEEASGRPSITPLLFILSFFYFIATFARRRLPPFEVGWFPGRRSGPPGPQEAPRSRRGPKSGRTSRRSQCGSSGCTRCPRRWCCELPAGGDTIAHGEPFSPVTGAGWEGGGATRASPCRRRRRPRGTACESLSSWPFPGWGGNEGIKNLGESLEDETET